MQVLLVVDVAFVALKWRVTLGGTLIWEVFMAASCCGWFVF